VHITAGFAAHANYVNRLKATAEKDRERAEAVERKRKLDEQVNF